MLLLFIAHTVFIAGAAFAALIGAVSVSAQREAEIQDRNWEERQ